MKELTAEQAIDELAVLFVLPAERMEHAADSVPEMQAEERHADDIEDGDDRVGETDDHHVVDVVAIFGVMQRFEVGVGEVDSLGLDGEVQEVIDDEGEDDQAADEHGSRGVAGTDRFVIAIASGARGAVFGAELDGGPCPEPRLQEPLRGPPPL